ncbi:unnamed protein product [Caenorhabditis brenneri]
MAWCTPTIEFEREVYFPGETVTGRAFVTTTKDMTARNVEITFFGKSLTAWRTKGDRTDQPVSEQLYKQGEETYVEMKHEVWKPEDDKNTFPAGDYDWKFSFDLPKECPASFEGKFGFIRYWVLVHIDVPLWYDTKTERAITVSPTIDLNSIPGTRNPLKTKMSKVVHKCCCLPFLGNNGKVEYTLSTPQLGYIAGDTIHVSAKIENRSTESIESIESEFRRRVIYRRDMRDSIFKPSSNKPDSQNSRSEIWSIEERTELCQIEPGQTKTFDFEFKIPPVCATIRSSGFIQVEYFVTFSAARWAWDCSQPPYLKIIVGNVPFLEPGTTNLPPHKFVNGDSAQCWITHLAKQNFHYQFPYYGNDEPRKQD